MIKPSRSLQLALGLLVALLTITSCGDDDTGTPAPQPDPVAAIGDIVINEVLLSGDKSIELFNAGSETFNVSDFWLCLGPGAYFRVGDLPVASGSASLAPGQFFAVNLANLTENSGGLGLYLNNDDFSSSANILSFVQYGAAGAARENVAVTAGIWTNGEFVALPANNTNSIAYDGNGNSASDWNETVPTIGTSNGAAIEPQASVIFNEVQFGGSDYVELYNNGDIAVDLSNYWLCLGPGAYSEIGSLTVVNGQLNLQPGELVVVEYPTLSNTDLGLGLYRNNDDFSSAANIVDFIQYGAASSPRENVAVAAGIWTAGDFIAARANARNSVVRADNASGDAAADWTAAIPSFGDANTFDRFTNIVINEVGLTAQYVELRNSDTEMIDVSDYWLCLGPGNYARLGDLNVQSGSLTLAPNALVVVEFTNLQATEAGLGLYRNNTGFGNAINILDFVQIGAAGSPRENVAADAGIWTTGDFVESPLAGNTVEFDGAGDAVADWAQAYPSFGAQNLVQVLKNTVAITEVDYLVNQQVEIRNNTTEAVDLSNYWLCLGPGEYRQISALPVVSGNTNLEAGGHLVVTFDLLGDASEGLGLYSTNAFADANSIVDFVQYGAAGAARENVAVAAGIWTAGEFIDNSSIVNGMSLAYDGGGISQADWTLEMNPTLGTVNR